MADVVWRGRLIGVHGIPSDATFFLEVPLRGLPGNPEGDIDILLVVPTQPEFATVIQVKRVKVSDSTFRTGEPNKLGELAVGHRQASLLAEIGFAQVYCFVIVVVDSRQNNVDPMSYDGLTPTLQHKIRAAITTEELDDRAGLIHHEIVQSMDDEPLGAGTGGADLKRAAKVIAQPAAVTEWVRQVIAQRK
jgi:hypothetical protein